MLFKSWYNITIIFMLYTPYIKYDVQSLKEDYYENNNLS